MEECGYHDRDDFFIRYVNGENFDRQKLKEMGYDFYASRNISAYIGNPGNPNFQLALEWD